jgi:hypothetical protein
MKMSAAVVLTIALLGTAIAWRAHVRSQHRWQCIDNLITIDGAKAQWAMDVARETEAKLVNQPNFSEFRRIHLNQAIIDVSNYAYAKHIFVSANYLPEWADARVSVETYVNTNVAPAWDDLRNYTGGKFWSREGFKVPQCPDGGTYTIGRLFDPPTCSVPGHKLEQ